MTVEETTGDNDGAEKPRSEGRGGRGRRRGSRRRSGARRRGNRGGERRRQTTQDKTGAAARRGTATVGKRRRARRERSAGGVVVRLANGEPLYLLIRDSYGHWGFPKGHLERGEPADRAALREVMEETGLRAVSLLGSIARIDWYFRFRGALIHKNCEFFLMQTSAESTKPQKSEGITACRWTTLEEALRLIAYQNARAVLQKASEMLGPLDSDGLAAAPQATDA